MAEDTVLYRRESDDENDSSDSDVVRHNNYNGRNKSDDDDEPLLEARDRSVRHGAMSSSTPEPEWHPGQPPGSSADAPTPPQGVPDIAPGAPDLWADVPPEVKAWWQQQRTGYLRALSASTILNTS